MTASDRETRGPEVVAIGEPLIALVAQQTGVPLVEVSGYDVHVTGAELNTAVGLARLGHRVAFAGRLGAEPFGLVVRRRLAMEGVDTSWLTDDERATGMLFRNLRSTVGSEVIYRRAGSAGSCITPDDITPAIAQLPPDGIVLTTGVTAAICPDTTGAIVQLARSAGRRLCVDLNYRSRLWSPTDAATGLHALAAGAHLVAASLDEASLVTGHTNAEAAAQALLAAGAEIVVLRHDRVAASWFTRGARAPTVVRSSALPATDPVGAGDAFMAGLLSGILEFGTSAPDRCVQRAHHCGAAVISTVGDLEGALYREELAALETGGAGDDPLR